MINLTLTLTRDSLLDALSVFVNKRPGISDLYDYSSRDAYRADCRQLAKARREFHVLRRRIELSQMPLEVLARAFDSAFSGRLSFVHNPDTGAVRIEYCAGQSYGHEFRSAARAVLVSALIDYWRADHVARTGSYDGARDFWVDCAKRSFASRSIVSLFR